MESKNYGKIIKFDYRRSGRGNCQISSNLLRLSEDLPVVIEIVDSEEKINQFIPQLDNMIKEGLITLEKANVIMYRA